MNTAHLLLSYVPLRTSFSPVLVPCFYRKLWIFCAYEPTFKQGERTQSYCLLPYLLHEIPIVEVVLVSPCRLVFGILSILRNVQPEISPQEFH